MVMGRSSRLVFIVSRICLSIVFLLNGFGVIDQKVAVRELIGHGAPAAIASLIVMSGRALQIIAGFGLALGIFPQWSALALVAFLVPATLVAHSFWLAAGTPTFSRCCCNFARTWQCVEDCYSSQHPPISLHCFRNASSPLLQVSSRLAWHEATQTKH
jgi:putative oxidoreductase